MNWVDNSQKRHKWSKSVFFFFLIQHLSHFANATKTALRSHLTQVRMTRITKANNKSWKRCEKRNTYSTIAGMQSCVAIMEVSMEVPHRTENRTTLWGLKRWLCVGKSACYANIRTKNLDPSTWVASWSSNVYYPNLVAGGNWDRSIDHWGACHNKVKSDRKRHQISSSYICMYA